MVILCDTLLPNDRVQAIPDVIGKIFKPTPVTDGVIKVDVTLMRTVVSTDSNTVFELYSFYTSFSICYFCF